MGNSIKNWNVSVKQGKALLESLEFYNNKNNNNNGKKSKHFIIIIITTITVTKMIVIQERSRPYRPTWALWAPPAWGCTWPTITGSATTYRSGPSSRPPQAWARPSPPSATSRRSLQPASCSGVGTWLWFLSYYLGLNKIIVLFRVTWPYIEKVNVFDLFEFYVLIGDQKYVLLC